MALGLNLHAPGGSYSAEAEAAIEQGDVVMLGTAENEVKKTTGATVTCVGAVDLDKAAAGGGITVYYSGIVWCRASAAIARGLRVTPAADGEVAAAADVAGTNYEIVGITMGASAAANDLLPVLLTLNLQQGDT